MKIENFENCELCLTFVAINVERIDDKNHSSDSPLIKSNGVRFNSINILVNIIKYNGYNKIANLILS